MTFFGFNDGVSFKEVEIREVVLEIVVDDVLVLFLVELWQKDGMLLALYLSALVSQQVAHILTNFYDLQRLLLES